MDDTAGEPDPVTEGARCLVQATPVRAGDRVLIHTEPGFDDPEVAERLVAAFEGRGAHVSVLWTPTWNKALEPHPPVLEAALHGIDILVSQGEFLRAEKPYLQRAMYDRGLVYINNETKSAEELGSSFARFPQPVMHEIGLGIAHRLAAADSVRITSPSGTDVTMGARGHTIGGYWYPYEYDGPGHKKGFPGGVLCFHPADPVDGVIVLDKVTPPKGGRTGSDPTTLTVEDHRVVAVEGAERALVEDYWETHGDEGSRWLGKCLIGIHPLGHSPAGRPVSAPGAVNFGFGNGVTYGGANFSRSWIQGFSWKATVTAGGEVLVSPDTIVSLSDERVRAAAERHGAPAQILSAPAVQG